MNSTAEETGEPDMPHRKCAACEFDEAIAIARKSGASMRALAERFNLPLTTIFEHLHHSENAKSPINIDEIERIDKEIAELRAAQNRAKRNKRNVEALAIQREIRSWHVLRTKATTIAGAQAQPNEPITPAEALALARAVIEAHLDDVEVVAWMRSLLDRVPAASELRTTGRLPESQE
jgi:hypothetical protein